MTKKEKNFNVLCDLAGIKLRRFQPNKNDIYNKAHDCSVRAICRLLNKDWDEVFKMLTDISLETKKMPNCNINSIKLLEKFGYERVHIKNKDLPKSIAGFIIDNREGRYFICGDQHAVACINSTIYDSHFVMFDKFISEKVKIIMKYKGEK